MSNVSLLYNHYLDLRKMRQERIKNLQENQKIVQRHEQSLFKIKNHLAQVLTEKAKVETTLKKLIESNIWVTAQEHSKMHHLSELIKKEYHNWIEIKKRKHETINQIAKDAKLHASHIIGIERALLCLEDQIRLLLICPKNQSKSLESNHQLFLRKSLSNYSLSSLLKDHSTSLTATLLNKWLKKRLHHVM